jgi:chemotaxis protein MotA
MDIATLIGIVAGMGLIIWAILSGAGLAAFLHVPSMMITIGGTLASGLINFPLAKVLGVFAVVKKTLLVKAALPDTEIARITEFAQVARREGLLALEDRLAELRDPLLLKGIQLVIDGTPPEVLRDILSIEVDALQQRHAEGKNILDQMGAAAPAFGMIGTLIGLVAMLQNLSDPSLIGAGMATALLTTFYGAFAANLFFIPLAGKLESRSKEEVLMKQIMIEGIISIQSGDNPRTIQEKLKSFVSPAVRLRMERQAAG